MSEDKDVTMNPFWGDPEKVWVPFNGCKLLKSDYIKQDDTAFHVGELFFVSGDTMSDIQTAFRTGSQQRVKNILSRIIVVECGLLVSLFDKKEWIHAVDEIKTEKARSKSEVEAEAES